MSLLMKALDKAAQDRGRTSAGQNAATPGSQRQLSLETMEQRSPVTGSGAREGTARGYGSGGTSAHLASEGPRSAARAQAATLLMSGRPSRQSGWLEWLRANPLVALGGAAALFLAAYGAYVYLQIAHPAWLRGDTGSAQPLATASPKAIPVPPPTPVAPRVAATDTSGFQPPDTTGSRIVPLSSVFGRANSDQASAVASSPPSLAPVAKAEVPTMPAAAATRSSPAASAQPAAATTPAATPPAMRDRIAISRGDTAAPRINPAVREAYAALQAGQFVAAQQLYHQALRNEPANVDALLGLAAIAQHENRHDDAQRLYMQILDVDPRHALAQSGLIALMGNADLQASESRLKQLISREPSAPLYFNLGNLYATQNLWPQAQQAYFQAHHLAPRNPDYAYNLAVGLEHLGQPRLALDFYRKAMQLAPAAAAISFDQARAQARIAQLAARVN